MDLERIMKRFVETNSDEEEIRDSIEGYLAMPLALPVEDEAMKRISQVMTNNGYSTSETCEGHGKSLPQIYFSCEDQNRLRHMYQIIARESREKTFPWRIGLFAGDPWLNPDEPLYFTLQPHAGYRKFDQDGNPKDTFIDLKKDYKKLLDDIDIIGISIYRYFESVPDPNNLP